MTDWVDILLEEPLYFPANSTILGDGFSEDGKTYTVIVQYADGTVETIYRSVQNPEEYRKYKKALSEFTLCK